MEKTIKVIIKEIRWVERCFLKRRIINNIVIRDITWGVYELRLELVNKKLVREVKIKMKIFKSWVITIVSVIFGKVSSLDEKKAPGWQEVMCHGALFYWMNKIRK